MKRGRSGWGEQGLSGEGYLSVHMVNGYGGNLHFGKSLINDTPTKMKLQNHKRTDVKKIEMN